MWILCKRGFLVKLATCLMSWMLQTNYLCWVLHSTYFEAIYPMHKTEQCQSCTPWITLIHVWNYSIKLKPYYKLCTIFIDLLNSQISNFPMNELFHQFAHIFMGQVYYDKSREAFVAKGQYTCHLWTSGCGIIQITWHKLVNRNPFCRGTRRISCFWSHAVVVYWMLSQSKY